MAYDLDTLMAKVTPANKETNVASRFFDSIEAQSEARRDLQISMLHTFPNHPFDVTDDEDMDELVASIKAKGVITPIIVRQRDEGGYEIISGHRRTHAAERAGLKTIPATIRKLSDEDALKTMIITNQQRSVKPSEHAKAYSLELAYIKEHSDLNDSRAIDIMAAETGMSTDKLYRYIRLAKLISAFLVLVDSGEWSVSSAIQLSQIDEVTQKTILEAIQKTHCPTIPQTEALRKHYQEYGSLTLDDAVRIISGKKTLAEKKDAPRKVSYKTFKSYFAKGTKEEDAVAFLQMLLEDYAKEHGEDGVIKI